MAALQWPRLAVAAHRKFPAASPSASSAARFAFVRPAAKLQLPAAVLRHQLRPAALRLRPRAAVLPRRSAVLRLLAAALRHRPAVPRLLLQLTPPSQLLRQPRQLLRRKMLLPRPSARETRSALASVSNGLSVRSQPRHFTVSGLFCFAEVHEHRSHSCFTGLTAFHGPLHRVFFEKKWQFSRIPSSCSFPNRHL